MNKNITKAERFRIIMIEVEMIKRLVEVQNNENELECISKLLEFYKTEIMNLKFQEIPISFLFIKLMKVLKRTSNKILITKALIITISFFEHIPADFCDNQGIEIDLLPLKYKKKALSQLKQEFLLN